MNPPVHEQPVRETHAPEPGAAVPAGASGLPARRPRNEVVSALKMLGFQLVLGAVLVMAVTLASREVLESHVVQALGMGTMFVVGFVDWRRWREIQWRWFPVYAAFMYAVAFLAIYLMPD